MVTFKITILIFLILLIGVSRSIIDTDKFNGYAIIGSSANNQMTFTTLLSKQNRTLPYSSANQYSVSQIFIQSSSNTFGSGVALGSALDNTVTIGVISDPAPPGLIYIYDIEQCVQNSKNKLKCNYLFSQSGVNNNQQQCIIGSQVAAGSNFVVTSCSNDLLTGGAVAQNLSPIMVCTFLGTPINKCLNIFYMQGGFWAPCESGAGQVYTNAIEVFGNKIIIGLCGVCMSPSKTQLEIEYISAFLIVEVISEGIILNYVKQSNRTGSCPSSITFNNDWVAIGYSNEGLVDIYYKSNNNNNNGGSSSSSSNSEFGDDNNNNTTNNLESGKESYSFFQSIYESNTVGYGIDLEISQNTLMVSSTGDPNLNITGRIFFYDLDLDSQSSGGSRETPQITGSNAIIPNLNYQTKYNYQYGISFYDNEVLVISQDQTLKQVGFSFFGACSGGSEWSSIYEKCMICYPGQYKPPSKTNAYNNSFELCVLCPGDYYSGLKFGAISKMDCSNNGTNICDDSQFCPDGSVFPLLNIPFETTSETFPNYDDTEELDFESTFYNSCYPYFLILMGGLAIITIIICFPWPKIGKPQKKILGVVSTLNFFDWEGDLMTKEELDYLESTLSETEKANISSAINRMSTYKRSIFKKKKAFKSFAKPVKILETYCTYYFIGLLFLMLVFIVQFQRINTDISTDLRSLGQASTQSTSSQPITDAQYLKIVDSSPVIITLDLFGYNGGCINGELSLNVNGCHSSNYMGICNTESSFQDLGNSSCRITTTVDTSEYDDTTDFYFNIKPFNTYFYAQRIIYNVSTNNNATSINIGNGYVSGIVQPIDGTFLRPNAMVSILSMITMVSDCTIKPDETGLIPFVRPMLERCIYNPLSFKEFSLNSNSTQFTNTTKFHKVTPTFQLNIHIEKSVFYHYLTNSHSTSFGQIITVILFSIIDVYCIIQLFVPIASTIIEVIEEKLKKRKKKKDKKNPLKKSLLN